MTVLGRGLVFQPVLVTQTCTYNSRNITLTLQRERERERGGGGGDGGEGGADPAGLNARELRLELKTVCPSHCHSGQDIWNTRR